MKDGDYAGLLLLQRNYGWVGVKAGLGSRSVVMIDGNSGKSLEVAQIPLSQNKVFLKAECDFKERAVTASFYYILDVSSWKAIGSTL